MDNKIVLDTNFLVAPFQLSFPLFEEFDRIYPLHQIYTLEDAVQEAKSIEGGKYKELIDKLLETQDIEVLSTEGNGEVDDLLVDIAEDYIIATNDKELKNRLLDDSREVVIIRSGDHLEVLNRSSVGF
ncbi:MAG: rRNA-processing protein FCF1 [Candidatus Nanohaloarchaea archaeon]|jgi:rRNA-processing protein FCF1